MCRWSLLLLKYALLCNLLMPAPGRSFAQSIDDRTISEHVRIRIPIERQWLGREVITELERGYRFINGSTGEKMPRRIVVDILWSEAGSRTHPQESRIVVGMNHAAAATNMKSFLMHNAVREMARLGLVSLARGAAVREESEFLMEGMAEILAREFSHSTRNLAGAWVLAQLLDRLNLLGLAAQASWSPISAGLHELRAAAPGVTFLLTCREQYGRDRTLKLFETLGKGSLESGLAATFKTTPAALEGAWLKKVRAFNISENVARTSEADAPRLERTVFVPGAGKPGTTLQMRLFIRAGNAAILPQGLYVQDKGSGRVFQARTPEEKNAKYTLVEIPIEPGRQPGSYDFQVIALDEEWNVSSWQGTYSVDR